MPLHCTPPEHRGPRLALNIALVDKNYLKPCNYHQDDTKKNHGNNAK